MEKLFFCVIQQYCSEGKTSIVLLGPTEGVLTLPNRERVSYLESPKMHLKMF